MLRFAKLRMLSFRTIWLPITTGLLANCGLQLERVLVESIKTMILADRSQLTETDIRSQLAYLKKTMTAKSRERGPADE